MNDNESKPVNYVSRSMFNLINHVGLNPLMPRLAISCGRGSAMR